MVRDKPLHNFLFETDPTGFYSGIDCFCTPWIDVCVILHLVRRYQPARFLEVGTHWGVTTRILAERFPEMQIITVDPGDRIPAAERPTNQAAEFLPQHEIGKLVDGYANVQVIRERFSAVEWFAQRFEMIFVDGNHSLPEVLTDSRLALELVTDPGVVIWHDYNNVVDVNKALSMLNVKAPIVSLHNTWIAYLDTH
jgi:hypothetical protein